MSVCSGGVSVSMRQVFLGLVEKFDLKIDSMILGCIKKYNSDHFEAEI